MFDKVETKYKIHFANSEVCNVTITDQKYVVHHSDRNTSWNELAK